MANFKEDFNFRISTFSSNADFLAAFGILANGGLLDSQVEFCKQVVTGEGKDAKKSWEVCPKEQATAFRRLTETVDIEVPSVNDIADSGDGEFILTQLLRKFLSEKVRFDFDNNPNGVRLPEGYKLTVADIKEALTPKVTIGRSAGRISSGALIELVKSFGAFLLSQGKSERAILLQVGMMRQKFEASLMATRTKADIEKITDNFMMWQESLNDSMAETHEGALTLLGDALKQALVSEEVTADDL